MSRYGLAITATNTASRAPANAITSRSVRISANGPINRSTRSSHGPSTKMTGGPKKAGAPMIGAVWANTSPHVGRSGEVEPGSGGERMRGCGLRRRGGELWGGGVHAARFLYSGRARVRANAASGP